MPLILIVGYPSSGKTTRTKELQEFFASKGKCVKVVSENLAIPKAKYRKNEYYADSQKEKMVRADLKSEAIRLLNKDDLVILDAGNYIKGYRYELYCASKSARTTQCTIFCAISTQDAWSLNEKRTTIDEISTEDHTQKDGNDSDDAPDVGNSLVPYTREIFDALILRFEEPNANNRWDSPMFTILPDTKINLDDVYSALYEKKPPPPNQATQNAPLSTTNYLYELDKLTQNIVSTVISARKIGQNGPVQIRQDLHVTVPANLNASQLSRLRRQFLNYNKMHTGGGHNLDKAADLFVQFLNSNF